jgi:hypothetical protein
VPVVVKVFNSAGEQVYGPAQPLMFYETPYSAVALGGPFVPDLGGQVAIQLVGAGQYDQFAWAGQGDGGQLVAGGTYMVVFQTKDGTGATVSLQVAVTVLRQQVQSSVTIYNSAGELVRHFSTGLSILNGLTLSSNSLVVGHSGVTITTGAVGSPTVVWDGLNDAGQPVAAGLYDIKVTKTLPGAADTQYSAWVQVLKAAGSPLDGLVAGPNPLRGPAAALTLKLPNLSPQGQVKVGLYTLAGELVYGNSMIGGTLVLPMHDMANGIYLLAVDAQDGAVSQRKVMKIAVVR